MDKNDMKYDKRLLERNIRQGNLTRADVDKHLEQLPDMADASEKLDLGAANAKAGQSE